MMYLFYISKYYEFLDTFLLYLNSVSTKQLRNFRPPLKERGRVCVSTNHWANFHT